MAYAIFQPIALKLDTLQRVEVERVMPNQLVNFSSKALSDERTDQSSDDLALADT